MTPARLAVVRSMVKRERTSGRCSGPRLQLQELSAGGFTVRALIAFDSKDAAREAIWNALCDTLCT
jgi:hypothetical protein